MPVVGEYNGDSVQSAQCVSRSLSPSSSCCSPDLSVPCGHGSKCEDSLETAPEVSKLDGGYAEDFEDSGSDESVGLVYQHFGLPYFLIKHYP